MIFRASQETHIYDVFLRNTEIVEGTINYEPVVIYNSSYDSIPTLAGRPVEGGAVKYDGVGRAVVAGEMTTVMAKSFKIPMSRHPSMMPKQEWSSPMVILTTPNPMYCVTALTRMVFTST